MKTYFVSYYWCSKTGNGHGHVELDFKPGIVLPKSSVPAMRGEILRLNPKFTEVVILNWIPFDSEIETTKAHDYLADITFTHGRDSAGAAFLSVRTKRTFLFSVPVDAVQAEHIANIFGKELIHS